MPLKTLFKRSFSYVHVVDMEDSVLEDPTEFDYHTPLLSTMRWLGIKTQSEINAEPYLTGDPMNCPVTLPETRFKIGVCWASGNHGPALMERRRVVPLTQFLPMSEIPEVSLISLQVGQESKEIVARGMEGIVFDFAHRLEDFSITADVISRLDLVISVDSAVAHLAGALGKPCMMLSPYTRCWRWWNLTSGWPWYERMGVFRQSENGTWTEAMKHVTKRVRLFVEQQNRDM